MSPGEGPLPRGLEAPYGRVEWAGVKLRLHDVHELCQVPELSERIGHIAYLPSLHETWLYHVRSCPLTHLRGWRLLTYRLFVTLAFRWRATYWGKT